MKNTVDAIVARNKQSRRLYTILLPVVVIAFLVFRVVAWIALDSTGAP
jgi:hypothetical protein